MKRWNEGGNGIKRKKEATERKKEVEANRCQWRSDVVLNEH
jgi:hypothetical protein